MLEMERVHWLCKLFGVGRNCDILALVSGLGWSSFSRSRVRSIVCFDCRASNLTSLIRESQLELLMCLLSEMYLS